MLNRKLMGPDPSNLEAQRFYAEATGALVSTAEHLDEWLSSLQVKDKTAKMRRATIGRLADKFPMLNDVSRKKVRRWVTDGATDRIEGRHGAAVDERLPDLLGISRNYRGGARGQRTIQSARVEG
jgi:hypothetical protein